MQTVTHNRLAHKMQPRSEALRFPFFSFNLCLHPADRVRTVRVLRTTCDNR